MTGRGEAVPLIPEERAAERRGKDYGSRMPRLDARGDGQRLRRHLGGGANKHGEMGYEERNKKSVKEVRT